MKKSSLIVAIMCVFALVLSVSCKTASSNSLSENSGKQVIVIYEGVFIDNTQEVLDIISKTRGDLEPYEHQKDDEFHVTVAYEPENPMLDKIGTKVDVHITGYDREVVHVDGVEASAEALSVTLHTDDEALQQYFDKNGMNWHITCSYSLKPIYSKFMDFSDANMIDYVVTGTFAAYLGDGVYAFSVDEL